MADATAELFNELDRRGNDPRLHGATGTMRFDLGHDRGTDRWFVDIRKGDVSVSRKNAKADCVVRADRELFRKIASGETNVMVAVMRGEFHVEGNLELAALFQRLIPGRPGSRDQKRNTGSGRRRS
jgi:putative sterol carrier protein